MTARPHIVRETLDNDCRTILVEGRDPFSGAAWSVVAPAQTYLVWKAGGMHIQHAFPRMSVDERELLLSGMTSSTFDDAAGPDDSPNVALREDEIDDDGFPF